MGEESFLDAGKHVLVTYNMKPEAGCDHLATAARLAADAAAGAVVYHSNPEGEVMKIAYSEMLFDRCENEGRAVERSPSTLEVGIDQGNVEYCKITGAYFPPSCLDLFDGPLGSIVNMWRLLGRDMTDGGQVVGTIIKPSVGLKPALDEACWAFWQGANAIHEAADECIPEVHKAVQQCIKETSFCYVKVRATTGETTSIQVEASDTIDNVKAMIREAWDLPVAQQRLIAAGGQLEGGATLGHYGIQRNSTLQLELCIPQQVVQRLLKLAGDSDETFEQYCSIWLAANGL